MYTTVFIARYCFPLFVYMETNITEINTKFCDKNYPTKPELLM